MFTQLIVPTLKNFLRRIGPKKKFHPAPHYGANPTLRHLPIRLLNEPLIHADPYLKTLADHLNTAVEDLYIINEQLNVPELDELLRRRFPL